MVERSGSGVLHADLKTYFLLSVSVPPFIEQLCERSFYEIVKFFPRGVCEVDRWAELGPI